MDFVADTLGDGRTFRVLNIVEDFSREALATEVGKSIPGTGSFECSSDSTKQF